MASNLDLTSKPLLRGFRRCHDPERTHSDYQMVWFRGDIEVAVSYFHPSVKEFVVVTVDGRCLTKDTIDEIMRFWNGQMFRWHRRFWYSRRKLTIADKLKEEKKNGRHTT